MTGGDVRTLTAASWGTRCVGSAAVAARHASLVWTSRPSSSWSGRAGVRAGRPARAREVLDGGRDAAERRGDDLDVDVAWSLALAEAMASAGARCLQRAARRLPGPKRLWSEGRRMAALEVTCMGAHLAETWDDFDTAAGWRSRPPRIWRRSWMR